ncbi:MAG: peptidylprolyl isomerase, partial [Planctomycetota bacterium]|nr:peptidylprolyl isomerase [Planctomycetota bacterium]
MIGILQPALFGTALWLLVLTGCSPSSDDTSVLGGAEDRFAAGRGIEDSELSNYWVQFEFSADGVNIGTLGFELFALEAPQSVRAFLRLVDLGAYDGTLIPRVEREFVLQGGGDPLRPDPLGLGGQVGDTGVAKEHHYGVIGWASPPAREFIICLAESPRVWALDHQGQV